MKYPLLVGALFPVAVLAAAVSLLLRPTPAPAAQTAPAASAPPAAVPTSPAAPTPATPAPAPAPTPRATPAASAPRPAPTSTAAPRPSPAGFTAVQYAEQVRGVIDQAASGTFTTDSTYAIGTVPQDTPALADGENVDLVRASCSVCHATTFITSQPPLPAATWKDEVYKMKEKYGATFISDENADKIIAYLSAHYTPATRRVGTPDAARPAGQP